MHKTGVLLLFAFGLAYAAEPQFEVASIKPNLSGGRGGTAPGARNGRFTAGNSSLKALISSAYAIAEVQISGPDWMDTQRFDIAATLPDATAKDQIAPMLRALLEQRFRLKTHRETAEMTYYALTIGKSGSKLKAVVPGEPVSSPNFGPGAPPAIQVNNGTVADFAGSLGRILGRPVLDKTGLTGAFHMLIQYTPPGSTEPGPDILTALQEQLGLKLESQKGPVEVLRVDSVDKVPTDN